MARSGVPSNEQNRQVQSETLVKSLRLAKFYTNPRVSESGSGFGVKNESRKSLKGVLTVPVGAASESVHDPRSDRGERK